MIVECNRCSTKYRVREDKFPEGGGNIKCPECGHVFFIKPPEASGGLGLRKAGTPVNNDDGATRMGTVPAALLGSTGGHPRVGEVETKADADAQKNERDEKTSWKLKTSFGLVYDFPDTGSLQGWLSSRDDLSGYQLSKDGQNFDVLEKFSELSNLSSVSSESRSLMGSGMMSSGLGGTSAASPNLPAPPVAAGPPPEMNFKRVAIEASPKTSKADEGSAWFAISAFFLLAVFAVIGLQLGGVVNFKKLIPQPAETVVKKDMKMEKANVPQTGSAEAVATGAVTPPVVKKRPVNEGPIKSKQTFGQKKMVKTLLQEAQKDIRKRNYDLAIKTLLSVKGLDPSNPEAYKLLEKVYKKKGMNKEAREARNMYKRLSK
jgi:predicted Zn finger-like uncharacterized protein